MKIKLGEIQKLHEAIIRKYKKQGQELFTVHKDYYWNIIKDEKYDLYNEPNDFTMGQLS